MGDLGTALLVLVAVFGLAALLTDLRRSRVEAGAMLLPMALGGLSVLNLLQVALFPALAAGAFDAGTQALRVAPRVITPVLYFTILLTYVEQGTVRAALLIPGLVLTAFFGGIFLPFYLNAGAAINLLVFTGVVQQSLGLIFRQQLAELATMVLAIYVLIVAYQLLANRLAERRQWLAGAMAMAVAGVSHAALYSVAGYGGLDLWRGAFLGELAGWSVANLALAPMFWIQLKRGRNRAVAEGRAVEHARPALDVIQETLVLQRALKRARGEARRLAANLSMLMELRNLMHQVSDPQESMARVCTELVESGHYEAAWIDLRLCKGWREGRVAMAGASPPKGSRWGDLPSAVSGDAGTLGGRVRIQRLEPGSLAGALQGARVLMSFPMEVHGHVEGCLNVVARREEIEDSEVRVLSGVADDIAHALVRHSIDLQRARRSAELRAIADLASQMVRRGQRRDLLQDILRQCAASLGCDRGWAAFPAGKNAEPLVLRWVGDGQAELDIPAPGELSGQEEIARWRAEQREKAQVVWVVARLEGPQSGGGLMAVGRPASLGDFEREDEELVDLFANFMAMTVEQGRLRQILERRARDLVGLNLDTREALSLPEPQEMAVTVARALKELMQAKDCRIALDQAWSEQSGGPRLVVQPATDSERYVPLASWACEQMDAGREALVLEADHEAFPEELRERGAETVIAMPIRRGEVCMGMALLVDPIELDYDDERWTLCAQALDSFSLALANVRAMERERARARAMEALREASLQLTSSLSLAPVLDTILDQTLTLIEADDAHIFLYEDGELHFGAARCKGREADTRIYTQVRKEGLTYTVARTGQRVVIPEVNKHPLYKDWKWGGAIVGLPLKVGDQVLGVMNVALNRPHYFSQQELETLELLADQAAIALQNARLFERLEGERRRVHMLFEVARVTAQSLDEREILQAALEQIARGMGGLVGQAFLYSPADGSLNLAAVAGRMTLDPREMDALLNLEIGKGLEGWVAEMRQPALLDDVSQDPRWILLPDWDPAMRCAICAPLLAGEELLGSITLLGEKRFEPAQLELLVAAANQVALGLANARRYQQLARRVQELSTIQQLLQIINRRVEMEALLREVVYQVRDHLGVETVRIFLVEEGELRERGVGEPGSHGSSADRGISDLVRQALETGEAAIGGQRQDQGGDPAPAGYTEIAMPLAKGDILIGVLEVRSSPSRPLGADDLNLLRLLADQVSIAVENASLYERLRQHMQELEQTVAERTAALTQALERAQEADRLKTQFVADVSHELRTPLTNIRLYLELLRYGNPERFPEYLETLERETGRLVDLIEDLLAISRLDAGTVSPNRVPLNLNDLANGLVKDRSRLFAEKQLEVRFEPYRHLPHVSADERMLSQVIANILTNALNYTHPGGSIVVRTQLRQEADGEWVTLSVSDTGIGIPPSEQAHVFERFFRGAASRDLGVPGTGLGLAICREIMRRHDGRITMESEFRKGSTFTLWLRPLGSDHPVRLAEGEAA